jgi:hypothetical protein
MEVPPGRNGLQPSVSLSYSSRALDGAIQNLEAGDIATGWSLAQVAIMRQGVKVQSDGAHLFIYHENNFSLVLNGVSYQLQPGGDSIANGTIRFYAKDAPGLKVWRHYNSVLSTDGLYWVVTTADGVQYRLGYTTDSEEYQQGPLWYPTPSITHWGQSNNRSAIAWNVDTVTDPFGNQMQYRYFTKSETETVSNSNDSINITTRSSRLQQISYNYPNTVSTLPATNIVDRLTSTPATTIRFRATTDSDPTFIDPITDILIFHNDATNPIREYRITSEGQSAVSSGCERPVGTPRNTTTRVVTAIRLHTNTDGQVSTNDMGYALPAVTFDYTSKVHFVDGSSQNCFYFRYLEKVHNGYGGTTTFAYSSDNRDVGDYIYSSGTDTTQWPEIGHNYYATEIRQNDGRNPDVKTSYSYSTPCYSQWGAGVLNCGEPGLAPQYGNITGFASATQTHYDYNGSTVLNKQTTTFSQNVNIAIGRPLQVDVMTSSNVVMGRSVYHYVSESIGGIANMFSYNDWTTNTQFQSGTTSAALSSKVVYAYDPANQGGSQYGNVTQIDSYDDANAPSPYHTTKRWYYPNTIGDYWLVNRVAAESTYGSGGVQLGAAWTYYDGNSSHQTSPSKGSPTRVRQFMTSNDNCNQTPTPPTGCAHYYLTAESSFQYDVYGNQTYQYGSNRHYLG